MRTIRRILRLLGFLLLLVVALAAGGVAVLTLTEKGRENLAGLISTMASSPGSGVQVTGISGIWSGPLRVESVVLSDEGGAWLAARGVAVEWWPLALLSWRFEASLVHADRIELARLPKSEAEESGGGLPISLSISRIDLPEIAIGGQLAGEVAQVSAEGSLRAEAEPLALITDMRIARTDGKQGALDAKIDFAPAKNQLAVEVHGSEPAGGIIANFLKLPGAPPVEIAVSGTGPAADWSIEGTFSVDGQVVTKVSGKRQLTDKGNRIEAKGEGAFERFVPEMFRPLLAGRSTFDFAGTLGRGNAVRIEHAELQSPAIVASAKGSIDPSAVSGFLLEVAARDAPARLSYGEADRAVTMDVRHFTLRAFGTGEAPAVEASASIEKLVTPQAELSGIEAKLHSDAFSVRDLTGPLTLSATAQSGGSADNTIAGLLAGAPKVEAAAVLSSSGLGINTGKVTTDTVSANVTGDIVFTDDSLKLAIDGELLSVLVPEAARSSLAEKVNVAATLNRDASGTVLLEPLNIRSGDFNAGGRISYASGALDVQLSGNLGDVSRFSDQASGLIAFEASAKGQPATPEISATISSDRLTVVGRQIDAFSLTAGTRIGSPDPAANVSMKATVANQALAGTAVLKFAGGQRRIDDLSLTLGSNRISGDLTIDEALVPLGTFALDLPDIAPLAALAFEQAAGAVNGTVTFSKDGNVPQIAIDARSASLARGDLSINNAEVTALVADYLLSPNVSGKVVAGSVVSGATTVRDVNVSLTRDGAWTGFSGAASIDDIAAKADGRFMVADGTATVELASASADGPRLNGTLTSVTTITVKTADANRDLTLNYPASDAPASFVFGEGPDATTITLGQASLHASGPTNASVIDLSVRLDRVVTPQAELQGIDAKLHSDGLDTDTFSGPVTVTATAENGDSADETIAGLLAGSPTVEASAMLSANGVSINSGRIATDTISASVTGDVSLADGSLKLVIDGELLSVLAPEAARSSLAKKVNVAAALDRDAAGTVVIEPLNVRSGDFNAGGRISYQSDALDVQLTGSLGDVSRFSDQASGLIAFEASAKGQPATPDISATISSDRLTVAGRQIDAFSLTAGTKIGSPDPAADVSLKGTVANQPLTSTAALKFAGGQRRIEGLSLTLGNNRISGDLVLDEAFVPIGTLALDLPDIAPLAALAFEQAAGAVSGTVTFSKDGNVPQIAIDAKAASVTRGDLSINNAEVTALVANYLLSPNVSGNVVAGSVVSGATTVRDVNVFLTREGAWTGFSGVASIDDIDAKADGRFMVADGTATVELASASANGPGLNGTLTSATTITVKTADANRDLTLNYAARDAPASFTFGADPDAVTITLRQASLHASGPTNASVIDLSARLDKVTTPQAELRTIEAKLHSGSFDIDTLSGPLTATATAESGGSADDTIAGLLAGALKADAAATLSQTGIHIEKGTVATDTVQADLSGDVSLADGSLELDVKANLLSALLPEAVRPALDRQVEVTAIVARDASGTIKLDPLNIVSGPFDSAGSVAYAPGAIAVQLKGGLDDISKLAAQTAGAIGFDISATGAPAAPDITATISSDKFTAVGREITGLVLSASGKFDLVNPAASVSIKGDVAGQPLAGDAVLKTTDGQRRIDGLTLTLGNNKITGNLALDAAFVPEGELMLSLPDIGPLAALALDTASGAVNGTLRFSKPDGVPQVSIDAQATRLTRGDLSVTGAEVTAQVADYLLAPAVSGRVRASSVTSGTTSLRAIDLSLTRDGAWTGFSGGATINDIEAKAAGRLAIAAGVTTIELASSSAKMQGITATLARPTTVSVKDGGATLDRLSLAVSGGTVQVTGTAGQQLNLDIQIAALPASVVNAFAPGLNAAGVISGSARITGAAAKPDVGYTLDWTGAQTAQTRDAGFATMAIASSGTLSANVLKFTANLSDGSGLGLKGGGSVDIGARTLSLDFSGQVPFGFLTSRLAAQGLALSGTSNVSLTVRGPFGTPVVGGSITTSGSRLVDARSGIAVNDIAADIAMASGVATLRRLTGTLSSGGSLSGSGTVGIDAARGFPADLTVKITDARYTDGRIVTANLSGDVALKGQLAAQPTLSGTINLARTVITIPERLPASIATLNVKHRNAPAAVLEQSRAIQPASAGNSGSGLTLDLTVNAPQQIYVRGRGLDAELGGSIKLTGPLASPQAVGEFTLRRGRLTILARRLDFTRGTLGFSGSLIPTLDLAAESTASDATVTVGVTGLATNPKFSFTSSPALPEDEVLARLVFGRSMSNLSALQIAQLADAAAQLAGAGGSSSLLNTLRGKIGVDDLDITTDDEGNAAVSAGKYLNDRTYVTIQKGDKAGSGKATIDLDVGRGVKLRGEVNESGGGKGGIFYEREY